MLQHDPAHSVLDRSYEDMGFFINPSNSHPPISNRNALMAKFESLFWQIGIKDTAERAWREICKFIQYFLILERVHPSSNREMLSYFYIKLSEASELSNVQKKIPASVKSHVAILTTGIKIQLREAVTENELKYLNQVAKYRGYYSDALLAFSPLLSEEQIENIIDHFFSNYYEYDAENLRPIFLFLAKFPHFLQRPLIEKLLSSIYYSGDDFAILFKAQPDFITTQDIHNLFREINQSRFEAEKEKIYDLLAVIAEYKPELILPHMDFLNNVQTPNALLVLFNLVKNSPKKFIAEALQQVKEENFETSKTGIRKLAVVARKNPKLVEYAIPTLIKKSSSLNAHETFKILTNIANHNSVVFLQYLPTLISLCTHKNNIIQQEARSFLSALSIRFNDLTQSEHCRQLKDLLIKVSVEKLTLNNTKEDKLFLLNILRNLAILHSSLLEDFFDDLAGLISHQDIDIGIAAKKLIFLLDQNYYENFSKNKLERTIGDDPILEGFRLLESSNIESKKTALILFTHNLNDGDFQKLWSHEKSKLLPAFINECLEQIELETHALELVVRIAKSKHEILDKLNLNSLSNMVKLYTPNWQVALDCLNYLWIENYSKELLNVPLETLFRRNIDATILKSSELLLSVPNYFTDERLKSFKFMLKVDTGEISDCLATVFLKHEDKHANHKITGINPTMFSADDFAYLHSLQRLRSSINSKGEKVDLTSFHTKFKDALNTLKLEMNALITEGKHNINYQRTAACAKTLNERLSQAEVLFFSHPTAERLEDFKTVCKGAIQQAEIEFKFKSINHRSFWDSWSPIIKASVEVSTTICVSTLGITNSVSPAVKTAFNYVETFFKKSPTEASKTLNTFQSILSSDNRGLQKK